MLSAFWGEWRAAEHKFLFRAEGTMQGGEMNRAWDLKEGECANVSVLARILTNAGLIDCKAGERREACLLK